MKKPLSIFIAAALFVLSAAAAVTAETGAYITGTRVSSIPSVRIVVDKTQLEAGGDFLPDAGSVISVPENSYYMLNGADWVDPPSNLKIGDTPKIVAYLSAYPKEISHPNYDQLWLFQGGYGVGNVSVSRGQFESAEVKESGYTLVVTLVTDPVVGTYAPPENAYWEGALGLAKWTPAPNSSGVYDIICRRDGTTVKSLTNYEGNSYNFYPYMTKAGIYTYEIRSAVPKNLQSGSAHRSDYVQSSPASITAENVSDGSGQTKDDEDGGSEAHSAGNTNYPNGTGNENVAGWVTDATGAYFRYPGGQYAKKCWLHLTNGWYRVDEKGKMITGWFKSPDSGLWYYLEPSTGLMKTGWLNTGNHWFWLRPEKDNMEGAMVTGWQRISNELYYFNESGIMVTGWYQIDGKWYYFYPLGTRADGRYGLMARNVMIGEFRIGPDGYWVN